MVEEMRVDDILEVRRALERAFIGKAVECCTEEDQRELDRIIAEMEEALKADENTLLLGLQIHRTIYRCLDNRVLNAILQAFSELWTRLWSPMRAIHTHEGMTADLELHRELVQAVHRRDVDGARAALEREFTVNFPTDQVNESIEELGYAMVSDQMAQKR